MLLQMNGKYFAVGNLMSSHLLYIFDLKTFLIVDFQVKVKVLNRL